jgi:hypothetical protein
VRVRLHDVVKVLILQDSADPYRDDEVGCLEGREWLEVSKLSSIRQVLRFSDNCILQHKTT